MAAFGCFVGSVPLCNSYILWKLIFLYRDYSAYVWLNEMVGEERDGKEREGEEMSKKGGGSILFSLFGWTRNSSFSILFLSPLLIASPLLSFYFFKPNMPNRKISHL